jgi:hypothetical protein
MSEYITLDQFIRRFEDLVTRMEIAQQEKQKHLVTNIAETNMADDVPDDLFPEAEIPLEAQIKCVECEITYRRRVFARPVSLGRMSETLTFTEPVVSFADQQILLMEAVLETLKGLRGQ